MSSFIKRSNLPEGEVTLLICGRMNESVIEFFRNRGIKILNTGKNDFVDESISEHCDISALYLGDGRIVVDKNQTVLSSELLKEGFEVIESHNEVSGKYPHDIILNQIIVGKYHIGKTDCCDKSVIDNTPELKRYSAKQGYAKCSCLVVDSNSIITDDASIYRKCLEINLESLLITKGDILLGGHEYGFIGGASGKISSDEVVFFGDITEHRDYLRIKKFLDQRKMKIISFSFPLTDFGGIIPIKEKKVL